MSNLGGTMHIGAPEPIVRVYEGSFGKAEKDFEVEKAQRAGDGYAAIEVSRVVQQRRLLPDITRIEVRYEYPAVEDGWTGARLVGDTFEVVWDTPADAKQLLKQLRLARKELVALKREQTTAATIARRGVRGTEAKQAVSAQYVALADHYDLRIRNLDTAVRRIEGWLLDEGQP